MFRAIYPREDDYCFFSNILEFVPRVAFQFFCGENFDWALGYFYFTNVLILNQNDRDGGRWGSWPSEIREGVHHISAWIANLEESPLILTYLELRFALTAGRLKKLTFMENWDILAYLEGPHEEERPFCLCYPIKNPLSLRPRIPASATTESRNSQWRP